MEDEMMTKFNLNKAEAGAFYTHAAMRALSTAEALAELAATTWHAPSHTATVRRLAKPLLAGLDAQNAANTAANAARSADIAIWRSLTDDQRSDLMDAVATNDLVGKNKRRAGNVSARELAKSYGLTFHVDSIDHLRALTRLPA